MLEWLLERNVSALFRVDPGREGIRPWTFHASSEPRHGDGWSVRADADSPEECLRRARKALKQHGLDLPE